MKKKLKSSSNESPKAAPQSAEIKRLEEVFRLMGAYGVGEVELEDKHGRLHVRMPGMAAAAPVAYAAAAPASAPIAAPAHPAPAANAASAAIAVAAAAPAAAPKALAANQKKITSPFVGTFYRASNPNAAPYAKEGQAVRKGQTLCIIEAMKLMNEIESELDGKIVQILVENGQPVEFGETLFIVEV